MTPSRLFGFFTPWAVYLLILFLQLALPAREVEGYVRDANGQPLHYRLNGLRVFTVLVALYAIACRAGWLPWDFFWQHRFESLAGACVLGLVFTLAIVLPAPPTPNTPLLADLYLGRFPNPQFRRGLLDAKMSLYLIGAAMLALNVLSFAAHQRLAFPGAASPGVLLYSALFLFFIGEYLFFEKVHLYTYDFFAERVGFKLGWGCLTFYPFFYCIGLWSEAGRPDPRAPTFLLVLSGVLFLAGWLLSRGANLQKFLYKTNPRASLLGIFKPETISDGTHALLCSGFWRASRHINYLGEILMATGLTLALGRPLDPIPWLYPIYYLALLVPRQSDDDKRCARKYGPLWEAYCKRVPYRIVPGLY